MTSSLQVRQVHLVMVVTTNGEMIIKINVFSLSSHLYFHVSMWQYCYPSADIIDQLAGGCA